MRLGIIYIVLLSVTACGVQQDHEDPEDSILASVYDQTLRLSDIQPLLQTESSPEDSLLYANSIVEQWARDAILMHEAERNIPADLDIQKMVNDYRSSLILMTYKQQLVEQELDTTITDAQLESYYEEHKSQYNLDEPILKCFLFKISQETERFEELDKMWKEKEYEKLALVDESNFELKLLDDQWYTWKDINALIPKNMWSYATLKSKEAKSKSSGDFKYFIKVTEYEDKNNLAPLSYIEDQAKKVILHKRQTELLDQLMENLYEKYSNNNNVKINI
ncbi:peptidylprolyl isomerase [Portibacter marinus]|uniref:hypothetical protein n=1 Tax=Portibacter marinus TaxID=2898660 RepID=UPI001F421C33|nr:hypothetical protein [Portibacter marinus]